MAWYMGGRVTVAIGVRSHAAGVKSRRCYGHSNDECRFYLKPRTHDSSRNTRCQIHEDLESLQGQKNSFKDKSCRKKFVSACFSHS